MRFAFPHMLWLLLLVPVIGAGLVWAAGYRRVLLARFGSDHAFVKRGIAAIGTMTWLRMGLFLLAVIALVFGLARPQWGYHERQVVTHGVDMVVAIDTSDSMMARDFQPTRLNRAKDLLRNLIWEAQGSRIGIVAFSGSAAVMCPLTLDYNMAATALKAVDTNTVSSEGTNIGAAINAAKGAFEVSGANDRVLVLLTDGEQLDRPEELDAAVKEAADQGIKIFAIGLGTSDGSTIPTMAGPKRSSAGDIVQTRLDFEKLEEIAELTQGEAIRAESAGAGEIAEISNALSKYRGRKQQDKTYRVYHDRYPWFVGLAALLLVGDALLTGVNRLRWGRQRSNASAGGVGLVVFAILASHGAVCAYPGEDYVRARDALQKYRVGEFDQSAALYQEASEANPQNHRIQFNLGAAAARAGKTAEARESLGKVYDPENPELNAYAQYGIATLDHRDLRKQIADKKKEWSEGAAAGEAPVEEIQQAVSELKSIIQEYKETILAQPDDIDMKANYELAKKDLEELEELLQENDQQQQQQQEQPQENNEEQQDQPQDGEQQEEDKGQQQQGQQNENKEDKGEEEQEQNKEEQEKQDGQQGEDNKEQPDSEGEQEEDKKPGEEQKGESEDAQDGDQDGQQEQPDPQGTPTPTPTPAPTPQASPTPQPGQNPAEGPQPGGEGQPVPIGQMSPNDVDRLLNTLPPENQQALQLMMGTPTESQDMEHDW